MKETTIPVMWTILLGRALSDAQFLQPEGLRGSLHVRLRVHFLPCRLMSVWQLKVSFSMFTYAT